MLKALRKRLRRRIVIDRKEMDLAISIGVPIAGVLALIRALEGQPIPEAVRKKLSADLDEIIYQRVKDHRNGQKGRSVKEGKQK